MGGSRRCNSKVEKPGTNECMLCDSIYMKFKNIEKVIYGVGDWGHGNLHRGLWLKWTQGRF